MREFRPAEQETHEELSPQAEELGDVDGGMRFSDGGAVPPVASDGELGHVPTASERAFAPERAAEAVLPEEGAARAFKPNKSKDTQIDGTFGKYSVSGEFIAIPAKGDIKAHWGLECDIEMAPNEKATGQKIAWVQVVRRKNVENDDWAKQIGKHNGMDEGRVKKTDQKTGFRVDRRNNEQTPFYGMSKKRDGSLTESKQQVTSGKFGGLKPRLHDTPEFYDNYRTVMEFVSTPIDVETGAQYDPIVWGFEYDPLQGFAEIDTAYKADPGTEVLAGRDRAIDIWNKQEGIDDVPGQEHSPVVTASDLSTKLGAQVVDHAGITRSLSAIKDKDMRERVKKNYYLETDRILADDLKKHLTAAETKKLKDWL